MERYVIPGVTSIARADHAGRIEAYLASTGMQTNGVQVRWDDELDAATVIVMADQDPEKVLASYVPTLTPEEQARATVLADAQAAIDAIAAKERGSRTNNEKILLGLALESDAVTVPSTEPEPVTDGRLTGRT